MAITKTKATWPDIFSLKNSAWFRFIGAVSLSSAEFDLRISSVGEFDVSSVE